MFTVCPKCALTLAVTAADLRVAQGYVRCGRCSRVFNALARLTDEQLSQLVNLPQIVPAVADHDRAAVRRDLHETVLLQPDQRVPRRSFQEPPAT